MQQFRVLVASLSIPAATILVQEAVTLPQTIKIFSELFSVTPEFMTLVYSSHVVQLASQMKVELCDFPLQKLSLFPLCYRMGPSTLTWCSGSFLILATYLLPVMSQTWTLVKVEYLLIAKTLVCNFHFPPLLVLPFGLKSPLLPTNFCAYPCL